MAQAAASVASGGGSREPVQAGGAGGHTQGVEELLRLAEHAELEEIIRVLGPQRHQALELRFAVPQDRCRPAGNPGRRFVLAAQLGREFRSRLRTAVQLPKLARDVGQFPFVDGRSGFAVQHGGSLLHDEGTGCREFGLGAVEPAAEFLDALAEFDGAVVVNAESDVDDLPQFVLAHVVVLEQEVLVRDAFVGKEGEPHHVAEAERVRTGFAVGGRFA